MGRKNNDRKKRTIYMDDKEWSALERLAECSTYVGRKRVTSSDIVRAAVAMVLQQYDRQRPMALSEDGSP